MPPRIISPAVRPASRVLLAILFGDIKGFSKLTDEPLPIFTSRVLSALAAVLRRHHAEVSHRNTWDAMGIRVWAVSREE